MDEKELQQNLQRLYPVENEGCEWKEFKRLRHAVSGNKGADIISYLSALANMNGGHLVIGVKDKSLKIVGIQDFHDYMLKTRPSKGLEKVPKANGHFVSGKSFKIKK